MGLFKKSNKKVESAPRALAIVLDEYVSSRYRRKNRKDVETQIEEMQKEAKLRLIADDKLSWDEIDYLSQVVPCSKVIAFEKKIQHNGQPKIVRQFFVAKGHSENELELVSVANLEHSKVFSNDQIKIKDSNMNEALFRTISCNGMTAQLFLYPVEGSENVSIFGNHYYQTNKPLFQGSTFVALSEIQPQVIAISNQKTDDNSLKADPVFGVDKQLFDKEIEFDMEATFKTLIMSDKQDKADKESTETTLEK